MLATKLELHNSLMDEKAKTRELQAVIDRMAFEVKSWRDDTLVSTGIGYMAYLPKTGNGWTKLSIEAAVDALMAEREE